MGIRMQITGIHELNKKKCKISFDSGEAIALYRGEMRRYEIAEGNEISGETYQTIITEILNKRARERVLYLLRDGGRTEAELRDKLKQGYYPEESIDKAIAFLKSYHYIDDEAYARHYMEQNCKKKSKRQIEQKLAEKGISREIIRDILEEYPGGDGEALEALLRKKNIDFSTVTREERQKICLHFIRKGFSYENISKKIYELESMEHLT